MRTVVSSPFVGLNRTKIQDSAVVLCPGMYPVEKYVEQGRERFD